MDKAILPSQPALSDSRLQAAHQQLGQLLARQFALYTMGDSSSLPVQTAQALLDSILFTLSLAPDAANAPLAKRAETGRQTVATLVAEGRQLLHKANMTKLRSDNIAYHDSYAALSDFFKLYDARFFAHDIPCLLDYPLCGAPPNGRGILFINEYLRRLTLENTLIRVFPAKQVQALLRAYVPDPAGQVVNLLEPVLTNALGRVLLGLDPHPLDIDPAGVQHLCHLFLRRPVTLLLADAAVQLATSLGRGNTAAAYITQTAMALAGRITALGGSADYGGVFLSCG